MKISEKIKKLIEGDTIPDGKQALMILAEECDRLDNDIIELKKRSPIKTRPEKPKKKKSLGSSIKGAIDKASRRF